MHVPILPHQIWSTAPSSEETVLTRWAYQSLFLYIPSTQLSPILIHHSRSNKKSICLASTNEGWTVLTLSWKTSKLREVCKEAPFDSKWWPLIMPFLSCLKWSTVYRVLLVECTRKVTNLWWSVGIFWMFPRPNRKWLSLIPLPSILTFPYLWQLPRWWHPLAYAYVTIYRIIWWQYQ